MRPLPHSIYYFDTCYATSASEGVAESGASASVRGTEAISLAQYNKETDGYRHWSHGSQASARFASWRWSKRGEL
jgi:hypothetical protein